MECIICKGVADTLHALVITGPKTLDTTEISAPFSPKGHDALVKVNRVSLCGSDYKLYHGNYGGPCNYPLKFGHEWAGTVAAVGESVSEVKAGDRVTGDCSRWCGECPNCETDKNICKNIEKFGITMDGFSQELVLVPEKYLYVAPDIIPFKVLALTECFAVALHAIRSVGAQRLALKNKRTMVIGCGPIGIALYLLLLRLYHGESLEIFDTLPERVELLQKILPQHRVGHSIPTKRVEGKGYRAMYNFEGYDVVFEATGKPEALQQAIDLANPMGMIITLGMYPEAAYRLGDIVMKDLTLRGSIGGTGEFPEVIKFFEQNIDVVSSIVSSEFSYQEARAAFDAGLNQKQNLKIQILFSDEE